MAACNKATEAPLPPLPGQIAFVSDRGRFGQFDIFLMNPDGSGLKDLTDALSLEDWPAWLPDGSKIAFMSTRNAGNMEIFVMNSDGTGVVQVTFAPLQAEYPSWSPDGAYVTCDRDQHVWVAKADGSQAWQITSGSHLDIVPRWRP